MLNKKREVTDRREILCILESCDTLRIGFRGDEYPYVVPVSFGTAEENGRLLIYFHCAKCGFKVEQIKRYDKVCFEGDIFYGTEDLSRGVTTRYESVIGFGTIEPVEGREKLDGLRSICAHYGRPNYDIANCSSLEMTAVYRITAESITGKRNLGKGKT